MPAQRRSFPLLSLLMIPVGLYFLVYRQPGMFGGIVAVMMVISGVAGVFLWGISGVFPADPAQAAQSILEQQKALYSGLHEIRAADPHDFAGVDLDYYDRTQQFLERNGFHFLGDVEDVTATREFPQMRSFLRVMSGDEGAVMAAIYHVKVRGLFRALQWFGAIPKQLKMLDLETELSDGSYIVSCNSRGADTTGPVPRVARFLYAPETTAEEVLRLHREQLQQAMIREPGVSPVPARTLEEVLASQNRLQEIKNAHKKKIGYMDSRELQNMAGGKWTPEMQNVADEIERQKRQS